MSTLADGILRSLVDAAGEPVSGQSLAGAHGVTRAAVWKAVEELRQDGCRIESQKGLGYRLEKAPQKVRAGELAAILTTERFGREARCLGLTDSTNRRAAQWAEEGAAEGSVVTADAQSAGRGRLGRNWHGKAGESLLFSVVLRPKTGLADAPLLTFVAAVALADTVAGYVPAEEIEIKWPNDVLVGGKKVAGILLESRVEGASLDYVILGVGINVFGGGASLPEDIRGFAATLEDFAGAKTPRPVRLLADFLRALERDCRLFADSGFSPFTARWNDWFRMAGKEVTVTSRGETLRGRALRLCEDGALLVSTGAGEVKIVAGDVAFATTRENGSKSP